MPARDYRIAELARRADLPVATVKFYLREGLLQRGTSTAATQAVYGEEHLRRLRLIRSLTDVGGMPLRRVRAVVDAIGRDDRPGALASMGPGEAPEVRRPADDQVDLFVDRDLGWRVSPDAPARRLLAGALDALRASGRDVDVSVFGPHARAAGWLVTEALEADAPSTEEAVLAALAAEVGAIALLRLAREHLSAGRSDRGPLSAPARGG